MLCLYLQHIPRNWFFSLAARRIYRASAILSVLLFLFYARLLVIGLSPASAPVVRLLLFLGAMGAGITLVAMWFYLLCFHNSHPLKQILWFFVMAVPFLGAPLYCFSVYSRATTRSPQIFPVEAVKSM